jgi:cytochrome P450
MTTTTLRQITDLPGPAGLPLLGNAHQIDVASMHLDLERWAEQYGSLYRVQLGPRSVLVIADPAMNAALLKDRPDAFRRDSKMIDVITEMTGVVGLFAAEGEVWQRQRRMVMASFSPANVRNYFPSLLRVTQRLRKRWVKAISAQQTLDLQAELMRFTVDAISGLAFGKDINTLESGDEIIQQHLDKIFPAIYRRYVSLIPYWRLVRLPVDRDLDRSVLAINQAIEGFIKNARERLTNDPALRESPQNLLEAMLIAADDPSSGISDNEVVGNVFTMLIAGEDTTATTLAWMIYLLKRNPDTLTKAREEARRVAPDTDQFTMEQMAELRYIEACAHEAMRLKPVGPLLPSEALKDTVVGDVSIPKGTIVMGLMRSAHSTLDDARFPDASAFKPERWLEGDGLQEATNAKRVSMPFGSGPRICPGRYLALLEIKLAMAMLLNSFEIESVNTPDGRDAQELLAFTMTPIGLTMRLKSA